MITVRFICEATLVISVATCTLAEKAALDNHSGPHCDSDSTSTCCKAGSVGGVACKIGEREVDDASLLQVELSSRRTEQVQPERHASIDEYAIYTRTRETNGSSKVSLQQSTDFEASSYGDRPAWTLRHNANEDIVHKMTIQLLQTTERTAMVTGDVLYMGSEWIPPLIIVIVIVVVVMIYFCCVVAVERVESRMQKLADTTREDLPEVYSRSSGSLKPQGDTRKPSTESEMRVPTSSSSPGMSVSNPGMALCSTLIIPEGHRLVCVVQNDLKQEKQHIEFDVRGTEARGARPLFRIKVSEFTNPPGITVSTLDSKSQLAFLSTEELWSPRTGDSDPVFSIWRPNKDQLKGVYYGKVQKSAGEFLVIRGQNCLMTIAGDFANHDVHIKAPDGRYLASTWHPPKDENQSEYQVNVQSQIDAGLIVLALLAVDKCCR